jgi:hypothetical protein
MACRSSYNFGRGERVIRIGIIAEKRSSVPTSARYFSNNFWKGKVMRYGDWFVGTLALLSAGVAREKSGFCFVGVWSADSVGGWWRSLTNARDFSRRLGLMALFWVALVKPLAWNHVAVAMDTLARLVAGLAFLTQSGLGGLLDPHQSATFFAISNRHGEIRP